MPDMREVIQSQVQSWRDMLAECGAANQAA